MILQTIALGQLQEKLHCLHAGDFEVRLGGFGRCGGSGRVMGEWTEWLVAQWIVGVISFQKISGLSGLNGQIVENW